jgi:hypothetical protein
MDAMTLAEAANAARKAMKGMYLGETVSFLRKAQEKLLALEEGEAASFYGLPFGKGNNPNGCAECHIRRVGDGSYRREVAQ